MRFAVMIDLRFGKCVRARNGTRPPRISPPTFNGPTLEGEAV